MSSFLENENQMVIDAIYSDIADHLVQEWINNNHKTLGIHIHAADGSITKDVPSGGVALTTLIYSLLNL